MKVGDFLNLMDKIESLIAMHQEGPYWDFKREWCQLQICLHPKVGA